MCWQCCNTEQMTTCGSRIPCCGEKSDANWLTQLLNNDDFHNSWSCRQNVTRDKRTRARMAMNDESSQMNTSQNDGNSTYLLCLFKKKNKINAITLTTMPHPNSMEFERCRLREVREKSEYSDTGRYATVNMYPWKLHPFAKANSKQLVS